MSTWAQILLGTDEETALVSKRPWAPGGGGSQGRAHRQCQLSLLLIPRAPGGWKREAKARLAPAEGTPDGRAAPVEEKAEGELTG